jgi:hypothetical protein
MRLAGILLVFVVAPALALAGCLRETQFQCSTSADCGANGTCEAVGFCSFADPACPDGRRFGELSGPHAGQCVGTTTVGDGGVDTPTGDGSQAGCPAGYAALPGVSGREYRVIATERMWTAQRDACAADGSNTYLAVPDDLAELTAIVTAGNTNLLWVGINDMQTEGTYVTTAGGTFPADSPLWAPDEPDNRRLGGGGNNADCVISLMGSVRLADDDCSRNRAAVCECQP